METNLIENSLLDLKKSSDVFQENEISCETTSNGNSAESNTHNCKLKEFIQASSVGLTNGSALNCIMCGKPTSCDEEGCVTVTRTKLNLSSISIEPPAVTHNFQNDQSNFSVYILLNEPISSSSIIQTKSEYKVALKRSTKKKKKTIKRYFRPTLRFLNIFSPIHDSINKWLKKRSDKKNEVTN